MDLPRKLVGECARDFGYRDGAHLVQLSSNTALEMEPGHLRRREDEAQKAHRDEHSALRDVQKVCTELAARAALQKRSRSSTAQ